MKSSAPALKRGIKVLSLLSINSSLSLEEIAFKIKAPKSSLLRILDTLCSVNHVYKDLITKKYTALSTIIPIYDKDGLYHQKIIDTLRNLSQKTMLTSEWYVFNGNAMVMTERVEATNSQIRILARIGWNRDLISELDSIAKVAIAHGLKPKKEKENICWIYDENGGKKYLEVNEIDNLLKTTLKNKCTMDKNYNSEGVRRYAAPVLDKNGKLYGILTLAENFTPKADAKYAENLKIIKNEAIQLTKFLK